MVHSKVAQINMSAESSQSSSWQTSIPAIFLTLKHPQVTGCHNY